MMPRFFIDYIPEERAILTGPDAHHIAKSLRLVGRTAHPLRQHRHGLQLRNRADRRGNRDRKSAEFLSQCQRTLCLCHALSGFSQGG